jgi:hypothetical protein
VKYLVAAFTLGNGHVWQNISENKESFIKEFQDFSINFALFAKFV